MTVTTKPGAVCLRSRKPIAWRQGGRRPPLHAYPSPRATCAVEDFDDIGQASQQGQDHRLVIVAARRGGILYLYREPWPGIVDDQDHRSRALGDLAPSDGPGTGLPDRQPQLVEPVLVQVRAPGDGDRDQSRRPYVPRCRRKP